MEWQYAAHWRGYFGTAVDRPVSPRSRCSSGCEDEARLDSVDGCRRCFLCEREKRIPRCGADDPRSTGESQVRVENQLFVASYRVPGSFQMATVSPFLPLWGGAASSVEPQRRTLQHMAASA